MEQSEKMEKDKYVDINFEQVKKIITVLKNHFDVGIKHGAYGYTETESIHQCMGSMSYLVDTIEKNDKFVKNSQTTTK